MNRAHAAVALGVVLVAVMPMSAQDRLTLTLTLTQAIDEALAKNHTLLDQTDTSRQADLGVRLAQNTFTPKIVPNLFGSFGQTNVASQDYRVDVTQKLVTGTQLGLGIGTSTSQIPASGDSTSAVDFYNADTTLTLSQPLLRGFGVNAARRPLTLAELRQSETTRTHVLTERQIAIETTSAYYHLVAQRAFVDVARKSFERATELRDASEAKLAAGLVSRLDALRAEQLVSQAESQLFDAESAVEDAVDRLTFLMGRDTTPSVDVDAEIPLPNTDPIGVDQAVRLALENRPELKTLAARVSDSDHQLSFARNQLLPQVDVNLALTRRVTANTLASSFGLDRFAAATFFTIAMPVDRTPQLVDFAQAQIDRERQKREIATTERQVGDEVKRALRERDRLLRAYATAESSIDISRQEVAVARLRYERGLSNNLDVVTAEGNLVGAESRRIQALADLATARVSLRAVVGLLDPRRDFTASALAGAIIP